MLVNFQFPAAHIPETLWGRISVGEAQNTDLFDGEAIKHMVSILNPSQS